MEKKLVKLKNGITFISQKLDNVHSVTISVNFKVGSLYEDQINNGITHLIEHLFFRQWDNLPQKQLYYEMQCMGAEIAAKTFHDYVSFSITVTPDSFIKAFKLITKCLNKFDWTDDIVKIEKEVVYKQIENDYQTFDNWIDSYYFKDTKYEKTIMGTIESVQSISLKDINFWKDKYFCSNNSCVAITGNYSDEDFLTVQNILSKINSSGKLAETIICYPLHFEKRNISNRYSLISNDTDISDITIFFDINKDYNYETVRLLSSILGEGCGSLLSMILRENYNFTDDIHTNLTCYCGFRRLSISFSVNNSDFIESLHHFFKSLVDFRKEISTNDYLTSINFFTKNQLFDLDNSNELNSNYVLCDFVLYPSVISEPIKRKEKYEKITLKDLKKYANDIFIAKNLSLLIQTNLDKKLVKSLKTEVTYDDNGLLATTKDTDENTASYSYNGKTGTLTNGDTSISYGYDSGSVRTTKIVNGVKYTYAYLNGQLLYETRGDAKFYYSYDANGILYNVRYTLTDGGTEYSYYYTHNSRGDIVGIYNGAGELKAHYEYDAWGNVISITDNNGNAITNPNHIGNLNPFRYRGYYQDTETGLYYLMSRYYDAVTHRFINADGYFQSGTSILDGNTFAYCGNNPVSRADTGGDSWFSDIAATVVESALTAMAAICPWMGSNSSTSVSHTSETKLINSDYAPVNFRCGGKTTTNISTHTYSLGSPTAYYN